MKLVEEIEVGENEIRKVMWICAKDHYGITPVGYTIVCPHCCHGGEVPEGFACQRCGERGNGNCHACGAPKRGLRAEVTPVLRA